MRPFVEKARRCGQRIRPASRRNRIIPESARTEAGEQTSRERRGPQSIRQAANDSKGSVVQLRSIAVGDEKGRLRRPSNAACVEAHDESIQSETMSRRRPGVCTTGPQRLAALDQNDHRTVERDSK